MEDASAARRPDPLAWGVFAVLAAIYRWGRCPSFGSGGSPTTVYRALYAPGRDPLALLGALASRLPLDSPEGHVNALSGLFHAAAAALLFALLRRLGIKRVPALAAVALAAFAHPYWYYALVAGRGPAAVFGLALCVWSVVAWNADDSLRPLAFGALGAALLAAYAPRADSLSPAWIWAAALGAGLLFQRLDLLRRNAAAGALAGVLLVALAQIYDARLHNPTLEYAQAVLASAGPGARVIVADETTESALLCEIRRTAMSAAPEVLRAAPGSAPAAPSERPTFYEAAFLGNTVRRDDAMPKGVLVESPLAKPAEEKREAATRAAAALEMSALTSVGERDLRKYGFTDETKLFDRYRTILTWYRDLLGDGEPRLRERLERRLADYGPAPRSRSDGA